MLPKHRSICDPQVLGNSSATGQPSSSSENAPANGSNVDRVLFKNLVEIVPLVESLMDRRANSSFTRRASMVYTATPAQLKKVSDSGSRKTVSAKKRRDQGDNAPKDIQDISVDDLSNFSSLEAANAQKDRSEFTMLREQVEDLQRILLEKEEALKSAEDSLDQTKAANASINELRRLVAEKESSMKSANSELYNAKVKLANKQADLEKLEWEAKMSNKKVQELQDDFVSMDLEMAAFMLLFEELSKNGSSTSPDDMIMPLPELEQLPSVDRHDEMEMEQARTRYLAAVAAAKENPCDESLAIAAEARLRLQAFAL